MYSGKAMRAAARKFDTGDDVTTYAAKTVSPPGFLTAITATSRRAAMAKGRLDFSDFDSENPLSLPAGRFFQGNRARRREAA